MPVGGEYEEGTEVDLLAEPDAGWHFDYWTVDVSGTDSDVTITMNADVDTTAVFEEDEAGMAPEGQIDAIAPDPA